MKPAKNFEDNIWIYILIAAACINLLSRGSIVFLLICILFLIRVRPNNIRFDIEAGVLALFSVSLIPAAILFYSYNEIIKALIYFGVYVVGYCGYQIATDKVKFIQRVVFSIFVGFSGNIILTYFYNLNKGIANARVLYNFWTGDVASVTLFGLLSSVVIGYSFYGFFCSQKRSSKIASAIALLFVLLVNINSATRTPFLMIVVVYVFMALLVLLNNKGLKGLKTFFLIVLLIAGGVAIYAIDLFGIQTFVMKSPLFARLMAEGVETSRVNIMELYLKEMPNYLWGGGHIHALTGRLAHNYLQELYDLYGLIPFILLLVISFYILKHMCLLIIRRKKTAVDFLFISMYLSMFLQLFLEPVFQGYPILFWSLLLIDGMVVLYLKDRKAGIL